MKAYLLDTQILLWWLSDDSRLSTKQREIIASPENQIVVSVVSFWEMVIKENLGKLRIPANLREAVEKTSFSLLDVSLQHIEGLRQLPSHHRDPFDRLLIAQAQTENLQVLTADRSWQKYQLEIVHDKIESHDARLSTSSN